MIERKFVKENLREHAVREYITASLKNVGHSTTKIQKTPLGEKIVIYASRPGLVVGRKGETIKELTETLKNKFKFENPQIEIEEVKDSNLDAQIIAERIASTLERFGANKFKGVGHRVMQDVMGSGALGVELRISGKIPGARAKTWRFYQGYLKKCGNISVEGVRTAFSQAQLKSGTIGIRVKIMPGDVYLPDKIKLIMGNAPEPQVVEQTLSGMDAVETLTKASEKNLDSDSPKKAEAKTEKKTPAKRKPRTDKKKEVKEQ